MTEAVVHHLEAVEVEEEHRDALPALLGARELTPEALDELQPVGQTGERVVHGLVRERLAAGAPLADVLDLAHEVHRLVLDVAHERRAHRHPHRVAVVVHEPLLELRALGHAGEESPHLLATLVAIVGMTELEHRRCQQLRLAASEDLHQRAVHSEQPTVDRDERHADRRVLERAAEPLLGLTQLGFGAAAVGQVAGADHDALDRRVVEQVGRHRLDHAPRAVAASQPQLDPVGAFLALAGVVEAPACGVAVVGMDEVEDVAADQRVDVEQRGSAR